MMGFISPPINVSEILNSTSKFFWNKSTTCEIDIKSSKPLFNWIKKVESRLIWQESFSFNHKIFSKSLASNDHHEYPWDHRQKSPKIRKKSTATFPLSDLSWNSTASAKNSHQKSIWSDFFSLYKYLDKPNGSIKPAFFKFQLGTRATGRIWVKKLLSTSNHE